jgi:hypothetical protein
VLYVSPLVCVGRRVTAPPAHRNHCNGHPSSDTVPVLVSPVCPPAIELVWTGSCFAFLNGAAKLRTTGLRHSNEKSK